MTTLLETPLLAAFLRASGLMICVWVLSLLKKDASLVDRFWGVGFLLLGVSFYSKVEVPTLTQTVLLTCLTLWSLRLSGYIQFRNQGHGEDPRYVAMREKRPKVFWIWSLFWVFLLQAFLMTIISTPVIFALSNENFPLVLPTLGLGLVLFLLGFFFETVGDWQMSRFRANPDNKGQVNDKGLWGLTRHPNYFGEAVLWWGFFLMSAPGAPPWAFLGPALLTFLLLRVSGVSLLEQSLKKTKPQYEDYMKRVPTFFPKFF